MTDPRILSAEKTSTGLIIVFDDGKTALYSASALYGLLPHLEGVINGPGPEELEEE